MAFLIHVGRPRLFAEDLCALARLWSQLSRDSTRKNLNCSLCTHQTWLKFNEFKSRGKPTSQQKQFKTHPTRFEPASLTYLASMLRNYFNPHATHILQKRLLFSRLFQRHLVFKVTCYEVTIMNIYKKTTFRSLEFIVKRRCCRSYLLYRSSDNDIVLKITIRICVVNWHISPTSQVRIPVGCFFSEIILIEVSYDFICMNYIFDSK